MNKRTWRTLDAALSCLCFFRFSLGVVHVADQCCAENFILFCFCRWLQNHTRTTFFFKSSFSAMAAIFSPDGRGCTAKYASRERFSGAAIDVRFRFLSPTFPCVSGISPFLAFASASSSHAWRMGFNATILLWLRVSDSNLQMVDWLSDPTPGNLRFANALPTSACVTPSLILRCLKRSANASSSRGSASWSGWMDILCGVSPWWEVCMLWGWYIEVWCGLWWGEFTLWGSVDDMLDTIPMEEAGRPDMSRRSIVSWWGCMLWCDIWGRLPGCAPMLAGWGYIPSWCFMWSPELLDISTAASASARLSKLSSSPPKRFPWNQRNYFINHDFGEIALVSRDQYVIDYLRQSRVE